MTGLLQSRRTGWAVLAGGLLMAGLAIRAMLPPAEDRPAAPPIFSASPASSASTPDDAAPAATQSEAVPSNCTDSAGPIATPASGNPAVWFTSDDYPADALRRAQEGTARINYEIGRDGRVAACRVTKSSGVPSLDAASCGVMTARATYRPAYNAAGCPVPSQSMRSIRWRVPAE